MIEEGGYRIGPARSEETQNTEASVWPVWDDVSATVRPEHSHRGWRRLFVCAQRGRRLGNGQTERKSKLGGKTARRREE